MATKKQDDDEGLNKSAAVRELLEELMADGKEDQIRSTQKLIATLQERHPGVEFAPGLVNAAKTAWKKKSSGGGGTTNPTPPLSGGGEDG